MAITDFGREQAFSVGIANAISSVRLFGTSGQIGNSKSITMEHSTTTDGRAVSNATVSFDVDAGETATEAKLFSAGGSVLWTVPLSQSYSFDVEGTFTLEEVYVQFSYDSNAIDNGGLTNVGAKMLVTSGFTDTIKFFKTERIEGGVFSTIEEINTNDSTSSELDSASFCTGVNKEFEYTGTGGNYVSQIYVDEFGSTFDGFWIGGLDPDPYEDAPFVHFKFSSNKTMAYPNNFTIEEFSVTIN